MPGNPEAEVVQIRPMGQGGNEIVEVSETISIGGDPEAEYESDGSRQRIRYKPRTADEANALRRGGDDVGHRRLVTWSGIILIFIVTLAAVLGFLGLTKSTAANAHEDAVRLLILIIGAVLGAVFGAVVVANKDPS